MKKLKHFLGYLLETTNRNLVIFKDLFEIYFFGFFLSKIIELATKKIQKFCTRKRLLIVQFY